MKLIKPSFTILHQAPGLEGVYKQIELAGRTCYKSEDKITPDSAKAFVERMINSGHGAMLEHGTVYLGMPIETIIPIEANGWGKYESNKYSKGGVVCSINGEKRVAITTNLRVLVENGWLDDLQYICEPTKYHEKRITVRFICDRGVSHEFVRHRVFSFAQESTRYCNYSKDKFGNELTFIQPCYLNEAELAQYGPYHLVSRNKSPESIFICSLNNAEKDYLTLIESGWKAQEARAVLPNALKTELVMTGFATDWPHFFELRCASNAHPQARELAIPLYDEFLNQKLI
ncbi:thymidylate synthase complementing protein ThyX [Bacteroides sp. CAG:633]|jgi:thymidylate synthase (FAD)|uniref:FAD-dependent thymidylate synthase n=1 Tax=Bacteroides sp. CAG:633 TaxID=1262744 RepID=UPI00033F3AE1|nr:FAD-dependent thymidylate synthase [Bacteroides sp. CAG:633]CDB10943.1 thymidylate synthase complementing protein ThyX [Bacteroides sp. CAG:633]